MKRWIIYVLFVGVAFTYSAVQLGTLDRDSLVVSSPVDVLTFTNGYAIVCTSTNLLFIAP